MKNKKKKCFWLILASLFIVALSLCLTQKSSNLSNKNVQWPKDGIYFLKNNSYLGYFEDEEPYIQLPFVLIHSQNPETVLPDYKTYTLKSNYEDIGVTSVTITESSKDDKSTFYTCGLNLQKIDPGIYQINYLQVEDQEGKKQTADIGNWIIEVKNGKTPTDLKIGKKMIFLGSFDWYRVELENSTENPIEIKSLSFNLPDYSFKTSVTVAADFDVTESQSEDTLLDSHTKKTYNYNFIRPTGFPKYHFISLKPFLKYEKKDKIYTTSLPNVIYSSPIPHNQELTALLNNINKMQ